MIMARQRPHPKNRRHPPAIRAEDKFVKIDRYHFSIFSKTKLHNDWEHTCPEHILRRTLALSVLSEAKDTGESSSEQDDDCYISSHPFKTGKCQLEAQILVLLSSRMFLSAIPVLD